MPVAKGLIKRVAAGKNPISNLFTEEQLLFLLSLASKKLDYAKVVVMGPVRAWRWKVNHPGLPWPITGELWEREDGAQIFEVSIKTPVAQAAAATAGFMAFLAEAGAVEDDGQQAKTRWVLEHYAAQVKGTQPRLLRERCQTVDGLNVRDGLGPACRRIGRSGGRDAAPGRSPRTRRCPACP